MKNLSIIAGITLFGLVGCNQADSKMADAKKIDQMVQVKLDSLSKELAADCDKQIMSAVKVKAAALAAARAKSAAPASAASKPAQSTTTNNTSSTTSTTTKRKSKLSGNGTTGGTASGKTGVGQKVKNTVNENFDPKKKRRGKLGGN